MRKIIAICGESNTGKTSVLNKLVNDYDFIPIIETTDRKPRVGESEQNPYYFLSQKSFGDMLDSHLFIGTSRFSTHNGYYRYGFKIEDLPKEGICVIQANWKNLYKLEWYFGNELISIKLCRNDKDKLLDSLNREPFPDVHEICSRFLRDFELYKQLKTDYLIINDNIDCTARKINDLVRSNYFE